MLKTPGRLVAKSLSVALASMMTLTATSPLHAQSDTEAPVLIHRQIEVGVAGELQTFLARVSDDFGVEDVVLYYRQSEAGEFESIPMRPLLDSIGEYMIAIETTVSAYNGLQYYIEATDIAGNTTNRGFSYAPIVLPLSEPVAPVQTQVPNPITPQSPQSAPQVAEEQSGGGINVTTILLGVGAVIALGALAAGGGGDDNDGPTVDQPVDTPDGPETVTLTVIGDLPSAN